MERTNNLIVMGESPQTANTFVTRNKKLVPMGREQLDIHKTHIYLVLGLRWG